jgi:hypothetical protein
MRLALLLQAMNVQGRWHGDIILSKLYEVGTRLEIA